MRLSLSTFILVLLVAACQSRTPDLVPENPGPDSGLPDRTTIEDLRPFLATSREQDYPLYPGDVIQITVKGRDDLMVERKIPPGGQIPLYGFTAAENGGPAQVEVAAAGMRVSELEEVLRGTYARIVPSPYVTVRVTEFARKVIYVAGEVKSPGEYELPNDRRISLIQALTKAGWFTEIAADDGIRIIRTDPDTGERIFLPPIDVAGIVAGGEVAMDIPLEPRDLIAVGSRASQSTFIYGHVKEPGEYSFKRGMTLSQLISRAAGLREFAETGSIRVLRSGDAEKPRAYTVDLEAILDGERAAFHLAPGDVVFVDERFI